MGQDRRGRERKGGGAEKNINPIKTFFKKKKDSTETYRHGGLLVKCWGSKDSIKVSSVTL